MHYAVCQTKTCSAGGAAFGASPGSSFLRLAVAAVCEEEDEMQTLDEWKTVLVKDCLELKHLAGQDANTMIKRSM